MGCKNLIINLGLSELVIDTFAESFGSDVIFGFIIQFLGILVRNTSLSCYQSVQRNCRKLNK